FQAEDGIRDGHVTGVQTCALPISCSIAATMTAGQAKVRGIESIAEGAARGLAEIVAAIEQVEHAALRVRVAAQANRQTAERLKEIGRASCRERGKIPVVVLDYEKK